MLFNLNKSANAPKAPAPQTAGAGTDAGTNTGTHTAAHDQLSSGPAYDSIYDAGLNDFEVKVAAESMRRPVLVDFWAPWCGPCKQLTPVLEAAVAEAKGAVALARINIDDNPELAQALRVQSVPTVYAFFQGQPVTAFSGARPVSEIKRLIDELVRMARQSMPDAVDIPETLALGAQALADADFEAARAHYSAVLSQDENNAAAFAGLIRSFIGAGALDVAQGILDDLPDTIRKSSEIEAAVKALEIASLPPADAAEVAALQQKIAQDENDHAARFALAHLLFNAGRQEEAMAGLLDIIRRDPSWEEEKARKQLVDFFAALGYAHPLTVAARKKLSSLLFA